MACNRYAGVAWQGDFLRDFWMWNGQFTKYEGSVRHIQTVKVADLKEAALRYWRDGWVPVKPVDEGFLRSMERVLREHGGLKREGVRFPEAPFLKMPPEIPDEALGAEVRAYLGLPAVEKKKLVPEGAVPEEVLESFKKTRGR